MFCKHLNRKYSFVFLVFVIVLTSFLSSCQTDLSQRSEVVKPVKVLVITGGHGFKRDSFFPIFDSFENTRQEHAYFDDISGFDHDVIVFYNFKNKLSDKGQANLLKLCEKGIGIVVLHHAVSAFNEWAVWPEIAGSQYFLKAAEVDGKVFKRSTYKHDVDMKVTIAKKDHPVTRGLEDFEIHDETYKGCHFQDDNNVLLTTDHPTSDKAIGWTRQFRKSKVCFIQLGHGPEAYANENYRKLVSQAIRWTVE